MNSELRDFFAALAMQELMKTITNHNELAEVAYSIADAMLEARKK